MKIFSFPPISSHNSIVLILGTMPGEKSLKLNQYYGHRGNIFWKLMFSIFNTPLSTEYRKRKTLLLENNIALWDVLKACAREGSSDNAIQLEESNDFKTFFDRHQKIKLIAFNGQNAEAYFYKYCNYRPEVEFVTLPSTSPANTWKSFDEKLSEWNKIKTI
jgi:hypoxanthine-DNA glycosylase